MMQVVQHPVKERLQIGNRSGCYSEVSVPGREVDHIILRSGGGQSNIEHLQLRCAHCNRVKSDRSQECLVVRLRELGIAA